VLRHECSFDSRKTFIHGSDISSAASYNPGKVFFTILLLALLAMVKFRIDGRLSLRTRSVSEPHFTPSDRTVIKLMVVVDESGEIPFYVWSNHGRLHVATTYTVFDCALNARP
jgi:hypothetical protein